MKQENFKLILLSSIHLQLVLDSVFVLCRQALVPTHRNRQRVLGVTDILDFQPLKVGVHVPLVHLFRGPIIVVRRGFEQIFQVTFEQQNSAQRDSDVDVQLLVIGGFLDLVKMVKMRNKLRAK